MDRWKSRGGNSQRREEKKQGDIEEKESEERKCRCTKRKTSCKGTSLIWASPKWPQLKNQTKTSFAKTRGFPTICLALKGLQRLAAGAKLLEGKLRVSRGWLEGHLLMKRMKCSGFCSVLKGHLERHIDGMQMAMKNPILMFWLLDWGSLARCTTLPFCALACTPYFIAPHHNIFRAFAAWKRTLSLFTVGSTISIIDVLSLKFFFKAVVPSSGKKILLPCQDTIWICLKNES